MTGEAVIVRECARCHEPFARALSVPAGALALCLSCGAAAGASLEDLARAAALDYPEHDPETVAAAVRMLAGELRRRGLAAVN